MRRHKKNRAVKSKSGPQATFLSPPEKALVRELLEKYEEAPMEILADKIPNAHVACALIDHTSLSDRSVIPLLRALWERFPDKKVHKATKRALFRLKSRGVDTDGWEPMTDVGHSVLRQAPREEPTAFAGPVGAGGSRGVLLIFQQTPRLFEVGVGMISDESGFLDFLYGSFGKKRTRELKEYLVQEAGPLVEISLIHAAMILEESYTRHVEIQGDPPRDYLELRPWLLENAPKGERAPIYELIPEATLSNEKLTLTRLERLFDHELMGVWVLPPQEFGKYWEEVAQVEESRILVTEAQKKQQIQQIRRKYTKELFPISRRQIFKRRFEEMAYMFMKLEQEEYGRLSLLAAADIDTEPSLLAENQTLEFLLDLNMDYYHTLYEEYSSQEQTLREGDSSPIILPR